jgi:hypothetical protein
VRASHLGRCHLSDRLTSEHHRGMCTAELAANC